MSPTPAQPSTTQPKPSPPATTTPAAPAHASVSPQKANHGGADVSRTDESAIAAARKVARLAERVKSLRSQLDEKSPDTTELIDGAFNVSLCLVDHGFAMAHRSHDVCTMLQPLLDSSADLRIAQLKLALDKLSEILADDSSNRSPEVVRFSDRPSRSSK